MKMKTFVSTTDRRMDHDKDVNDFTENECGSVVSIETTVVPGFSVSGGGGVYRPEIITTIVYKEME